MVRRSLLQRPVVVAAAIIGLLPGAKIARAQADPHPAFEVATLKQVSSEADASVAYTMLPRRSGDSFIWCTSLNMMLSYAYDILWTRIEGFNGPNGLHILTAKLDPAATEDQGRLMLRAFLLEKLKMTAHVESREVPGYALIVAKKGPKLKEADASGNPPPMPEDMKNYPAKAAQGRTFTFLPERGVLLALGRGVPISQLADELSKYLKAPVVDRTGLTGKYYFGLKFQQPELSATSSELAPAPDLSSALPDQLGLKLEKRKVSADFLVIDHFEAPTPE